MAISIKADVSGALRGVDNAIQSLQEIVRDPRFVQLIVQQAKPVLEHQSRGHLIRRIDERTTRRTGRLRASARVYFRAEDREIVGRSTFPATAGRYGQRAFITNAKGSGRGFIEAATSDSGRDPRIHSAIERAAVGAFNVLLKQRLG